MPADQLAQARSNSINGSHVGKPPATTTSSTPRCKDALYTHVSGAVWDGQFLKHTGWHIMLFPTSRWHENKSGAKTPRTPTCRGLFEIDNSLNIEKWCKDALYTHVSGVVCECPPRCICDISWWGFKKVAADLHDGPRGAVPGQDRYVYHLICRSKLKNLSREMEKLFC